ncbi:MAG: hypothetical protein CR974_04380 [Gammaproteobacteria bacterium]|nr:MAG: hypothetical protein CR974_04380 [Gammaproteobacteria bacterium]
MEQRELFDLPNPCIGVCLTNNRGYCKGCFRSREERQLWFRFSSHQKYQVLKICRMRHARAMRQAKKRRSNEHPAAAQKQFDF